MCNTIQATTVQEIISIVNLEVRASRARQPSIAVLLAEYGYTYRELGTYANEMLEKNLGKPKSMPARQEAIAMAVLGVRLAIEGVQSPFLQMAEERSREPKEGMEIRNPEAGKLAAWTTLHICKIDAEKQTAKVIVNDAGTFTITLESIRKLIEKNAEKNAE